MGVVGNFIGQVGQLRLQAGLPPGGFSDGLIDKPARHAARLPGLDMPGVAFRAVLQNTFARLERQVQAVIGWVTLFQCIDDAKALQVVLKAGAVRVVVFQAGIQRILPGMAERRVAQVVCQGNRLDQIFIELQGAGNGAAQLRDFQ